MLQRLHVGQEVLVRHRYPDEIATPRDFVAEEIKAADVCGYGHVLIVKTVDYTGYVEVDSPTTVLCLKENKGLCFSQMAVNKNLIIPILKKD